jgi:hypothetical protein
MDRLLEEKSANNRVPCSRFTENLKRNPVWHSCTSAACFSQPRVPGQLVHPEFLVPYQQAKLAVGYSRSKTPNRYGKQIEAPKHRKCRVQINLRLRVLCTDCKKIGRPATRPDPTSAAYPQVTQKSVSVSRQYRLPTVPLSTYMQITTWLSETKQSICIKINLISTTKWIYIYIVYL